MKKTIFIILAITLVSLSSTQVLAVSSDNSSDNADLYNNEIDLNIIHFGGINDVKVIKSVINEQKMATEKRINNSVLIKLKKVPVQIRDKVLNLAVRTKNILIDMNNDLDGVRDVKKAKKIVKEKEVNSNITKLDVLQNQGVLLLKNYNRLYDVLQNTYVVVNNSIQYIDFYLANNKLKKDDFISVQNARKDLYILKTDKLDVLNNLLDNKMEELGDLKFDSSKVSSQELDAARRAFLNSLVLDFPEYKDNYNAKIKPTVINLVNRVINLTDN